MHKIKKIKISKIFWKLQIDEIENKMSKIIKKHKKTNSKPQNFEKKNISHINIYFKKTFRIFQKSLVKSLTLPIKHHKKFDNFCTS